MLLLEILGQVHQVGVQFGTGRHTPQAFERHVELPLALQRQAHHAVRLLRALVHGPWCPGPFRPPEYQVHYQTRQQTERRQHQMQPLPSLLQPDPLQRQQGNRQDHGCGNPLRHPPMRQDDSPKKQDRHQPTPHHGPTPGWLGIEVSLPDAGHLVRQEFDRCELPAARHAQQGLDAGRRGTNQNNLVPPLRRWNLALEHILKRKHRKRRRTVMVRIDLRAQQGWTSAWQQQPPQAQGMAIHRFDLRRPQVQAVHGRQQRQGGHRCTIETQEQGCLANDAIHPLGPGLHVPDACSCLPEQRQRLGRSGKALRWT